MIGEDERLKEQGGGSTSRRGRGRAVVVLISILPRCPRQAARTELCCLDENKKGIGDTNCWRHNWMKSTHFCITISLKKVVLLFLFFLSDLIDQDEHLYSSTGTVCSLMTQIHILRNNSNAQCPLDELHVCVQRRQVSYVTGPCSRHSLYAFPPHHFVKVI